MTAVLLPSSPGPVDLVHQPIPFGGTQQGALGGAATTVVRQGMRWQFDVTLPPMTPATGREWSAALVRGKRLGVRWKIRQVGFNPGAPGTPRVNGGSQAGSTLACDGFAASYVARAGQFFSIVEGGIRFVHMVQETQRASSGAFAALEIEPPLRVQPSDNAVLEFGVPYIEGELVWESWMLDARRLAGGFAFSVREKR